MSDWLGLLWLILLLLANAFFVGSEFAVISARRSQIEPAAEREQRGARLALWAMEHATLMLATTQLGITVCSLLILNVSEPAIHHLLEGPLALTGMGEGAIATASFIVAVVLVSYLHVVLGEMVPKNLSFSYPDRAVLVLGPAIVGVGRVVKPVTVALNAVSNGIVRLFGVQPRNEAVSVFTLDEVETIVQHSTREGVLQDSTTLTNAFEFSVKRASDVMVPLDKLVRLPVDTTPAEVERAVARYGFSRYVLDEGEQPVGYIHLKDVLDLEGLAFEAPIPRDRVRPLVRVDESAEIEDVLALLRREASHLARTADEAGRTTGVIFLEDILEELVGEVQDATKRN